MTVALDERIATYDGDFCAWLEQQAALIRAGRFDLLDAENVAEELEGLSRSDQRALRSHLKTVILHLLKWQEQSWLRSKSWKASIDNAREEVFELIEDSPSLRPTLPAHVAKAYPKAVNDAVSEMGLPKRRFPRECPYSVEQILDHDFLPDAE